MEDRAGLLELPQRDAVGMVVCLSKWEPRGRTHRIQAWNGQWGWVEEAKLC